MHLSGMALEVSVINILFIVTESKSANGICCRAVMEQLVSEGHNIYCITNSEYTDFPKTDGVFYKTVKPRLTYRLFAESEITEGINKKIRSFLAVVINKIKLFISIPTWPLISPLYSNRLFKAAFTICKNNKIDCIIPVYTQIDTLIAARRIKRKFPDIKYIPYFLDSFSGGYGPKIFSTSWVIKRGIKWEDKLLPEADKIVMMKSCEEHYKKYSANKFYYNKILFLDLPLFIPRIVNNDSNFFNNDKINLLYIGTIPVHIRNPEYFLKLFCELSGDDIALNIIGSCTAPDLLYSFSENDKRIHIGKPVNHKTALSMISSADFLINFGNNNTHMTPCKIFEYMSYGKPIISVSPIKDEPSSRYLEKYPLSLIIKEYENNVAEDIEKLKNFVSQPPKLDQSEFDKLNELFYLNKPEAFIKVIKKEVLQ